ncbi:hypothetical protein LJR129_005009 [Acidovorax sp. LjRoot129]|uniref:hypothetical protein n=1 Tax=unclassified Acidovorax TaxID=2684926 RepID=UPI003ECE6F2F
MRSKTFAATLFASFLAFNVGMANAGNISDFFSGPNGKAPKITAPAPEALPEWLKDSRRLQELLGSDPKVRIENPKVIHKVANAFPGLDAYVVEGTEYNDDFPDGKKTLYFFYSDPAQQYLFIGMAIDMKRGRDVSMDLERYLRGQLEDTPAKALRPQEMHSIELAGGKTKASPLTFVVDLGPQAGKDSFLNVVQLHRSLKAAGENPRTINFVFVSNAKSETAGAAMAIAYGSHAASKDGIERAIEYARNAEKTAWLQPRKLTADAATKQMLGTGIFKLDNNSTQALLAKLDTLPLLYEGAGGKMTNAMLPLGASEWKKMLLAK